MKKIPLTRGEFAIVDDEDFSELNKHKWWFAASANSPRKYPLRTVWMNGRCCPIAMARQIVDVPLGSVAAYLDGNPLNLQKRNLRVMTRSQANLMERIRRDDGTNIKFRGVYDRHDGKWVAMIVTNCEKKYLGCFGTPEAAARAYDRAAIALRGKYARTNFPLEDYANGKA